MKTVIMLVLMSVLTVHAQVMVPCLTMEETNAQHNQAKANAVVVKCTYTQQLQCHYQQLATYWQQKHKDNQQKAKDLQQIAKDKQQADKDAQQIATDLVLAEKIACLNTPNTGYDELLAFLEVIMPYLNCTPDLQKELKRIHTNRSGGGDSTNPGGQGNIRGFDNPAWTIINK